MIVKYEEISQIVGLDTPFKCHFYLDTTWMLGLAVAPDGCRVGDVAI